MLPLSGRTLAGHPNAVKIMFRHVVLFTWTEEATDEQKATLVAELAKLPGAIPEIRAFTFGPDAGVNPGNQEFVAAYQQEFTRAPSLSSAAAYAGCQLFVDAVKRVDSLDADKLREALLKLKSQTVFGDFAVDERGFQVAHKAVTVQWQDGKSAVV